MDPRRARRLCTESLSRLRTWDLLWELPLAESAATAWPWPTAGQKGQKLAEVEVVRLLVEAAGRAPLCDSLDSSQFPVARGPVTGSSQTWDVAGARNSTKPQSHHLRQTFPLAGGGLCSTRLHPHLQGLPRSLIESTWWRLPQPGDWSHRGAGGPDRPPGPGAPAGSRRPASLDFPWHRRDETWPQKPQRGAGIGTGSHFLVRVVLGWKHAKHECRAAKLQQIRQ